MKVINKTITRTKKRGKGKRKGSGFEREVAKGLSLWISGGFDKDLLWRSNNSGARATMGQVTGAHQGDIAVNKPDGVNIKEAIEFVNKFYIECKFYKKLDFAAPVLNDSGNDNLSVWWKRIIGECKKYNKEPLLIVKRNGMSEPIYFINGKTLSRMQDQHSNSVPYIKIKFPRKIQPIYGVVQSVIFKFNIKILI
jgi:hypothetical protein